MTRCPRCGGLNGTHGLVHVRHDNSAGHNRPCPRHAFRPDVWADDPAYYAKCPECGKTEAEHESVGVL